MGCKLMLHLPPLAAFQDYPCKRGHVFGLGFQQPERTLDGSPCTALSGAYHLSASGDPGLPSASLGSLQDSSWLSTPGKALPCVVGQEPKKHGLVEQ